VIVERIAGSRSLLPIALIISVRSHLRHQRTTSLLALLAIASSVGLAVSSETSLRSVGAALQTSADALVGDSDLQVTGGERGIPEHLLERVRSVPGVQSASPMILETFMVPRGPHAGEGIRVLGVDLLEDRGIRGYEIRSAGLEVADPLRLLTQPESLIVTAPLAARFGLSEGDSLPVRSVRGELDLVVRGTLADAGVARAWGGQLAIMDIYGLQVLLGREGSIDRIDVVRDELVEPADLSARLQAALGGRATVSDASFRDGFVDTWLGVLNVGLLAMVVIGVFIAALLSFGTVSLAADRRMREFALLAAAGLEQPRIRKLILVDALVLAVLGTALGGALGVPLSQAAMSMFSGASQSLHDVEIPPLEPGVLTVLVALGVGLGVALLGSLEPARRAGSRDPIDVLKAPRVEDRGPARRFIAVAFLMVLTSVVLWMLEVLDPVPRAVLTLVLGGLGAVALALGAAPQLVGALRPALARMVRRIGHLAGSYVEARPLEAGVAIAATALISGGLVMSLVIIQTIIVSVDTMLIGAFEGGYYVRPASASQTQRELIPLDVVERIRDVPGVVDVAEFFDTSIMFRGEEVPLEAYPARELARNVDLGPFLEARGLEGLLRGELAMSRGFSTHFGVTVGETIDLPVGDSSKSFRIAGFLEGFGDATGFLSVDTTTFDETWGHTGATFLTIWTEDAAEDVLSRVHEAAGDYELFVMPGDEAARAAEARFERFGALLYVVAGIMGALVGAAMLNMLAGAVVARSQELGLLQSSGATPFSLVCLVLLDGFVVAVVGSLAGLAIGLLGAAVIREAITLSLGWKLLFTVDPIQVSAALGAVVISSVLAAIYPAWIGSRARPDVLLGAQ
jgi:putative ABC transport system permease protein